MTRESWHQQPAPMTWTENMVLARAARIGVSERLLEITLRSAAALAWNPAVPSKPIRGPGAVQYRLEATGKWQVRLHPIGRCMGAVKAGNYETKQCDVNGLPAGTTRCSDHHAPGTVGA